ncbi:MAG: ABC transporter ATP-binding protein [Rectinemataceae bacterium]
MSGATSATGLSSVVPGVPVLPGVPVVAGGVGGPEHRVLLSARDLSIGWGKGGKRTVLASGISFDIASGSLTALVGPNGSGKSTLLRTLLGMQDALAGHVSLDGDDPKRMGAEERSLRAACVFTEKVDSGYFTVFDIVAFGRYPYTDARNRLGPEDLAKVEGALDAVGLRPFAGRRFAELSDGEKQKAQIARAVAQDTGILVFDEPTAFLDAPSRIEVFHLVAKLAHDEGKAVVLCTHEVDLALRFADELWVFDRAHRFEAGNPAVVSHSGAIGRAFDLPGVHFDPASGSFKAR